MKNKVNPRRLARIAFFAALAAHAVAVLVDGQSHAKAVRNLDV
jgi:hypothetical protein